MTPSSGATIARAVAGLVCAATAACLAGFSAVIGAKVGGLSEGGWNWQFLMPLYVGWIAGFLITLGVAVYGVARKRVWHLQLIAILVSAPLTTFALSAVYHFLVPASV